MVQKSEQAYKAICAVQHSSALGKHTSGIAYSGAHSIGKDVGGGPGSPGNRVEVTEQVDASY